MRLELDIGPTPLGIRVEKNLVTVAVVLLITVPPERRSAVGEFFLRVNGDLSVGSFELDFDNGGMDFRIGLLLVNAPLPGPTLDHAIVLAGATVEGYLPALKHVLFDRMHPDQAAQQGEAYMHDWLKGFASEKRKR